MKRLLHIVGARPNFPKIAPIYREVAAHDDLEQVLVHTGQHYDREMSDIFFDEFGLPEPDVNLGVGSGSHAVQTAQIMTGLEPVMDEVGPDWVVVVGDVNSTLAAAIVASKKGIPVAHVEAGLRSYDRSMPEEVNRVLTDQIADLLLTPSEDAGPNLLREGIDPDRIRFVGNVMIDTLVRLLPRARERWPELSRRLNVDGPFTLVTLHRPGNVDPAGTLTGIWRGLEELADDRTVLFPVHPRTRLRIRELGLAAPSTRVRLLDPLGYVDFLSLTASAAVVVTDSGGVQEETTYLGIPCVTVRPNTERPVTIEEGTNRLCGPAAAEIVDAVRTADGRSAAGRPKLWDGKAAERIVAELRR